jgi:hypothetical protein
MEVIPAAATTPACLTRPLAYRRKPKARNPAATRHARRSLQEVADRRPRQMPVQGGYLWLRPAYRC